jgi:hypothetical protein
MGVLLQGRHGRLKDDEVLTLDRREGVARACPCSITRRVDRAGVGSLARRDRRGCRYPLAGLLAIAILATAAGMRGYAGFATWAATAPEDVLARLGIRFRRPCEKTFRSVLSRIDPADLDRRLGTYFTAVATEEAGLLAVAVDGKTLRGARGGWARPRRICCRCSPTAPDSCSASSPSTRRATKSPACGSFSGCSVTCGCWSRSTPCTPRSRPHKLSGRIQALPWSQVPVVHREEPQRRHGRTETRILKVLTAPRGIGFPYARQMIQMTRERITGTGERSIEVVYGICSAAFELARPAMIAAWLRDHWGIENAVHWSVTSLSTRIAAPARTGAAPQVMASLRNTALNLHRLHGADHIAEACRATALSTDGGLNLLTDHQNTWSLAC